MPKYNDYSRTDEELTVIEEAIASHPDPDVVKRALALRWLHQGKSPPEVAEMLLVQCSTVYNWYHRWLHEGLAGLVNRPKSGRPRKATPLYRVVLEEALASDPATHGYTFTVWTTKLLRQHLERETGIDLSRKRFGDVLAELGYVYRRPKRDFTPQQDVAAKAQVAAVLEELKKAPKVPIASCSLWTKPS